MRASTFRVHIDHLTNDGGLVWAIRWRRKYILATHVKINATCWTEFKGPDARQPKAYLKGMGVVRKIEKDVYEIKSS